MQFRYFSTIATLLSTLVLMEMWQTPGIAWWQLCGAPFILAAIIERVRNWEARVFAPILQPVLQPLPAPLRLVK